MPIQRPTVGRWRGLLLQSPTQCAHAQQQQYLLSQRSGTQLLGSYHDKIHLPMEYTTIFRSHIVYSMGAYKALSIVAINYLYIRQIPRTDSTTKCNTLPKWMIHSYWVSAQCTLCSRRRPATGIQRKLPDSLFQVQSCLWENITLQYSRHTKI